MDLAHFESFDAHARKCLVTLGIAGLTHSNASLSLQTAVGPLLVTSAQAPVKPKVRDHARILSRHGEEDSEQFIRISDSAPASSIDGPEA